MCKIDNRKRKIFPQFLFACKNKFGVNSAILTMDTSPRIHPVGEQH